MNYDKRMNQLFGDGMLEPIDPVHLGVRKGLIERFQLASVLCTADFFLPRKYNRCNS